MRPRGRSTSLPRSQKFAFGRKRYQSASRDRSRSMGQRKLLLYKDISKLNRQINLGVKTLQNLQKISKNMPKNIDNNSRVMRRSSTSFDSNKNNSSFKFRAKEAIRRSSKSAKKNKTYI